jgi:hypothetical protein
MCKQGILSGHNSAIGRDGDSPSHPRIGGKVREYVPSCCSDQHADAKAAKASRFRQIASAGTPSQQEATRKREKALRKEGRKK